MLQKIKVDEAYSFSAHESIEEIAAEWRSQTKALSIFFSVDFLRAVQNAPPEGMSNRYLLLYKDDILCGVLSCQLKSFQASESIKFKKSEKWSTQIANTLKSKAAKMIHFEGIVCGSVLLTGMYAYHFNHELTHKEGFELAEKVIDVYKKHLNENGHQIKVTFLKDFYDDKKMIAHDIADSKYQEFSVQPNMILNVRRHWKSYEDYLSDFQSKYRVRAKRARKKFGGITRVELDYVDIKKHNASIYALYENIVDNINFNLFYLHTDYFAELKKNLKEKFRLFGYFKGEKMVAFYTCIDNIHEMNAHFLGYDPQENINHQLYLNSLYDMVELSLKYNFTSINFSRTAMEIKSSIGAEPYDMLCYLKHENPWINKIVARIVVSLNPTEEWQQRRPFKSETTNEQ